MMSNILNMTNEEVIKEFRNTLNTESLVKCQRSLEEYKQKIDNDFKEEWSKKHFKWFFKKHRQRKLRSKIMHRYTSPIFSIVEDYIEDMLPKMTDEFIENLVDIKDVALGEPNYFIEEDTK